MLPDFSRPIADARRHGMRPARMVLIAYGVDGLHRRHANPVVRVKPSDDPMRFDWSWLAGLDAEIVTTLPAERTLRLVDAILPAQPRCLRVWNPELDRAVRVVWNGRVDIRDEDRGVCLLTRNFPYRTH